MPQLKNFVYVDIEFFLFLKMMKNNGKYMFLACAAHEKTYKSRFRP